MELVVPDSCKDLISSLIEGSRLKLHFKSSCSVRLWWIIKNYTKLNELLGEKLVLDSAIRSESITTEVGEGKMNFRLVFFPRSVKDGVLQASLCLESDVSSSAHIWYQLSTMENGLVDHRKRFHGRSTLGGCLDLSMEYLVNHNDVEFYSEIDVLDESLMNLKELKERGLKRKDDKDIVFFWYMENFEVFFSRLEEEEEMTGPAIHFGKSRFQIVVCNDAGYIVSRLDFVPHSEKILEVDYKLGIMLGGTDVVWCGSTLCPDRAMVAPIRMEVGKAGYERACFQLQIVKVRPFVEGRKELVEDRKLEKPCAEELVCAEELACAEELVCAEENVKLEKPCCSMDKDLVIDKLREELKVACDKAVLQSNKCKELEKMNLYLYDRLEKSKEKLAKMKMDMEERLKSSESSREKQKLEELEKITQFEARIHGLEAHMEERLKSSDSSREKQKLEELEKITQCEARIHGLEAHIHGLETHIHGIHGLEAHIQGLEAHIHGQEEHIQGLVAHNHWMQAHVQGLLAHNQWMEARINNFQQEIQTLQSDLQMSIYAPVYGVSLENLSVEELRVVYRVLVRGVQELSQAIQERGAAPHF